MEVNRCGKVWHARVSKLPRCGTPLRHDIGAVAAGAADAMHLPDRQMPRDLTIVADELI
jgi:hypothetical protein